MLTDSLGVRGTPKSLTHGSKTCRRLIHRGHPYKYIISHARFVGRIMT